MYNCGANLASIVADSSLDKHYVLCLANSCDGTCPAFPIPGVVYYSYVTYFWNTLTPSLFCSFKRVKCLFFNHARRKASIVHAILLSIARHNSEWYTKPNGLLYTTT